MPPTERTCRSCLFIRQEYADGLSDDIAFYCDLYDVFKSLDGFCDCWEPQDG